MHTHLTKAHNAGNIIHTIRSWKGLSKKERVLSVSPEKANKMGAASLRLMRTDRNLKAFYKIYRVTFTTVYSAFTYEINRVQYTTSPRSAALTGVLSVPKPSPSPT